MKELKIHGIDVDGHRKGRDKKSLWIIYMSQLIPKGVQCAVYRIWMVFYWIIQFSCCFLFATHRIPVANITRKKRGKNTKNLVIIKGTRYKVKAWGFYGCDPFAYTILFFKWNESKSNLWLKSIFTQKFYGFFGCFRKSLPRIQVPIHVYTMKKEWKESIEVISAHYSIIHF